MQVEQNYMLRCLELAKSGRSAVAPNPMVGAVIVHQGRIIGEGFHRQYGGEHAEVNAINSVSDKRLLRDSTLYVNLEPCSHHGKTPPCTALIIQQQIPGVVIGCLDPFHEVAGSGVKQLCDAGIEVVTDVMRREAVELNRYFITAQTKQRPYIILKWAQSRDGFLDRIRKDVTEKPVQLSNPANRRYVHKSRSEVSAIMVGTNTAWLDNPFLTVRHWIGQSPVRVCIDRTNRIPSTYHLLDGSVPTIVFVKGSRFKVQDSGFKVQGSRFNNPVRDLRSVEFKVQGSGFNNPVRDLRSVEFEVRENIEYIQLDFSEPVIPQVLNALVERKLYSLLVEGGACLHRSFLDAGMWDELQIEITPVKLGDGVKSPIWNLSEIAEYQKDIRFSTAVIHEENPSFISVFICENL